MKLVVITPEVLDPHEPAVLATLFAEGLERCHVRKPSATREELAVWLRAIPAEFRSRLVLHQHHDLVAELSLGGRHWRDDGHAPLIPPKDGAFNSRSCHDLASLRDTLGCYDSVFFGPVFSSISKPGHGPAGQGTSAELSALLRHRTFAERRTRVIALGGVTAENNDQCRSLGFDGVAVIGFIWQATDPLRAFAQLQLSLARHAA
jgi:thiamine-phosphate pyrophosphorylase